MARKQVVIEPQPGPQTQFLANPADIVIYGGAAFGGKTFGLLLDPTRHLGNKDFRGTAFRRHTTELLMPGGLWEKAQKIYRPAGIDFKASPQDLRAHYKKGWALAFRHLNRADTVYQYQGLETDWLGFDELTHFYYHQFKYLITRARSTSGTIPRIKGACNPDPDSWVKELIRWWLDEEGRFPDYSKSGVIRWFVLDEDTDEIVWHDSKESVRKEHGDFVADFVAMSVTFIPAKMTDNQIGMKLDPRYVGKLAMQNKVDRARLRDGDWLIKASPGIYFKRGYFEEVEYFPELTRIVRFWDRAATEVKSKTGLSLVKTQKDRKTQDADYTCSVRMGLTETGEYVITDLTSDRISAHKVERLIKNLAKQDTSRVKVMAYKDPGAAGKGEAERFERMMAGFDVETIPATIGKETNAKSFSAQAEAGNIKIWSKIPLRERNLFYSMLESFPGEGHDDYVDAGSGAFNELANGEDEVGFF